jgi:hypothetical protein
VSTHVQTFGALPGTSGCIEHTLSPSVYTAYTGLAACRVFAKKTTPTKATFAFFQFDASSAPIPDNATITGVEFFQFLSATQPAGSPELRITLYDFGQIIGAALNGTAAEFGGGDFVEATTRADLPSNVWLDLLDGWGQEDKDAYLYLISRTGTTDVRIRDGSIQGDGDSEWGINFNGTKESEYCKLRITYTLPGATATGSGTASASATVAAAGSATATGRGTSQAPATVGSVGSSTATGRGTAQATASTSSAGSATSTGRGTATAEASVTGISSVTATGRGTSSLAATADALGSATLTGIGTAEASGTVTSTAWASATATGLGTASCSAEVEQATASATATGRGWASCHARVEPPTPMARHFARRSVRSAHFASRSVSAVHRATRSVAAVHAATRSVSTTHHATCSCKPANTATRGSRRITDVCTID